MAQKVHVVMVDDIDGGEADETVSFSLDGVEYEIDLSEKNAAGLRDALAPYVGSARKTKGGRGSGGSGGRRGGRRPKGNDPSPADMRAWARENGYTLSDRGRVPAEVREAYLAAH
jgi:hypothetical protein